MTMASRDRDTVRVVADSGLCVSCLACARVCPSDAITYRHVAGVRRPVVDESRCTACGRCTEVCPGYHLPGADEPMEPGIDWVIGEVRACFTGRATDDGVRAAGVSGGIATALLLALRERGVVDHVFGLPFNGMPGTDADLAELADDGAIRSAAGSKYAPPGIQAVLDRLESDPECWIAVTATPCCLQAIRLFMEVRRIDPSRVLSLGLVCDRTLSPRALGHLAGSHGYGEGGVRRISYRDKRDGGWPGGVTVEDAAGRVVGLGRDARIELKTHYVLRRCVVCADKLNRHADVVLADCYVPRLASPEGLSTIVVRTAAGEEALARCADAIALEPLSVDEVAASQGVHAKLPALDRAVDVAASLGLPASRSLPSARSEAARREVARAWKRIAFAERAPWRSVRRAIVAGRVSRKLGKIAARVELVLSLAWLLVRAKAGPLPQKRSGPVRSVVVTGAGFSNRGAQALLFAVMDAVRERFPDAEVHVAYPTDIAGAQRRYRVRMLPWTHAIKALLWGWPLSAAARRWYPGAEHAGEVRDVLAASSCVIDVSGFRLSSEFGVKESLDYCANVLLARVLGIPCYVLPQSFGPFGYRPPAKWLLGPFIGTALRSATAVWAREREGFELVERYRPRRLALAPDIVLAHEGRDFGRIYRAGQGPRPVRVPEPAACIIPSLRVMERRDAGDVGEFYARIAGRIAESGRSVVLLSHSHEDAEVCERITHALGGRVPVNIAPSDLDAIELEELIGRMDFLVASRYHSVVHAYRRHTPAVILGWAVKYRELAGLVGQERYVLGADASAEDILAAVDELSGRVAEERELIASRLRDGLPDASAEVMREIG